MRRTRRQPLSLTGNPFGRDGGDAMIAASKARCLSFSGVNEYARVDGAAAGVTASGATSFSLWMRHDGAISGGARALLVWNNGVGGTPDNRIGLWIADTDTKIRPADQSGFISGTDHQTTNVCDNEWHHVLMTRASGGAVELYVDGVREFSAASSTMTFASTDSLLIGAELDPGGGTGTPGNYWSGDMTAVAVWDSALTASALGPALHSAGAGLNLRKWINPAPSIWIVLGGLGYQAALPNLMLDDNAADLNNFAASDIIQTGL